MTRTLAKTDADTRYGSLAYWRASAGTRPSFTTPHYRSDYDVVIVGGGFHGLWTAYHLLKSGAGLSVALLERHHIGFGATGRNGGFATPKIGMRVEDLERRYGPAAARNVIVTMQRKLDELIATIESERIDCELDHGGLLLVGANKSQEKRVRRELLAAERIGLKSIQPLTGAEVRQRLHSPTYSIGAYDPHCAVLHPLKLARGLAQACVQMGLDVYEDTDVRSLNATARGVEIKSAGDVVIRARKVVLALNAWAGFEPRFRRTVLPVYTYILMTEPLSEAQWAEIGWARREGVEDTRIHLHFYRRTRDGRILWGGSDNTTPFLGRIDRRCDSDPTRFERLESTFRATFPALASINFDYRWGGCFAMTPDFNPHYGVLDQGRLIYGHGCCGHGVGLSFFGGQIMRDLALERPTEADELLFMQGNHGAFPREPLRSIGATLTLAESRWFDDAQDRGLSPAQEPWLLRMAPKIFN